MTVDVYSLLGQIEGGEEGLFSEGLLGEKEGAWWDLKEQMVVIREHKNSKSFHHFLVIYQIPLQIITSR